MNKERADDADDSYIYLGRDMSNIADIIEKISEFDKNHDSPLYLLKKQIDEGCIIGHADQVREALRYAALVVQKNYNMLDPAYADNIITELEIAFDQIANVLLAIDSDAATRIRLKNLLVKHLEVLDNSLFHKNLRVKQNLHVEGHLHVDKSAHFNSNVHIDGRLSIADMVVASCVDNLCINQLSVNDAFIANGSIQNLTISATLLDSLVDNLAVTLLSAGDAVINNANIHNLSAADVAINNLMVANCMANLCVDNLSAANGLISGALAIPSLSSAGVIHNDVNGLLSSSLIVGADISPSASIVDTQLATISSPGKVANSATTATSNNMPNTIVLRDASGNFAAGVITADLVGNASSATNATNFSGILAGEVSGAQGATVVNSVGGQSAANIASAAMLANAATNANTPNALVLRDASGNFAAGVITADLIGNASSATNATNFSGALAGEVSGAQGATVVNSVGGQSAANIASAAMLANAATSANTPNTLVERDAAGNFAANVITADLVGNASSATNATNFSGVLAGEVSGTQGATVVNSVGGQAAADIASAVMLANAATSANVPNTIVERDAAGNFAAGVITADLIGNASSATTTAAAVNFSGPLAGEVSGTQGATVVNSVGGQSAANIAAATMLANAATNLNTPNSIVTRNAAGNFAAGTVTLDAGSSAAPSLQFNGSTNTGLSAAVANMLSVDVNGNEMMNISPSGIIITPKLILTDVFCEQAILVNAPLNGDTVAANVNTAILLLKPAGAESITVQFPTTPTDGQYFTIVLGTNVALTVANDGLAAAVVNGLTSFGFAPAISSASYVYYAADNAWYRIA